MKSLEQVKNELAQEFQQTTERFKTQMKEQPHLLQETANRLLKKFVAEAEAREALSGGISLDDWDGIEKLHSNFSGTTRNYYDMSVSINGLQNAVQNAVGEWHWNLGDLQENEHYEFIIFWRKVKPNATNTKESSV